MSAPRGCALRLPEDAVDAWRFERLLGEGRELLSGDPGAGPATASGAGPVAAGGLLREPLALWQGPAYAESADEPWSHAEILRLDELRLAARELRIAAGLRGSDPAGVVAEAALLTRDEPLREEASRLHALALWAAGRQAEALAALRRDRTVLAAEVGLDPGAALAELERAVPAQDGRLLAEATGGQAGGEAGGEATGRRAGGAGRAGSAGAPPRCTATARRGRTACALRVGGRGGTAPAVRIGGSGAGAGRSPGIRRRGGAGRAVRGPRGGTGAAGRGLRPRLGRRPAVALVTGEAGLGKSALLHRLGDRLSGEGWLVALGRTSGAEGVPPAWAWVEALRTVAALVPPGPDVAADLAPLLGDGPARAGASLPGEDAAGRFRLHRAVWRWLGAVAREQPLAVVLDDLHWADAETLALLGGAGELPAGTPLLVVGAHRPDAMGDRLAHTLAAGPPVPGTDRAERSRGGGGGRGGPGGGRVRCGPETLAALAERTGGNPFYVRESDRLLAGEGALVALSDVPEGVRDVLRRWLGGSRIRWSRCCGGPALDEPRGAAELYDALLPYVQASPASSGFTVAMRPVARTLGELAVLLGREADAAEHFARAELIAARWRGPWGRRDR